MLRLNKLISKPFIRIIIKENYYKRVISSSTSLLKKYKYAINKKTQQPSGVGGGFRGGRKSQGTTVVDGTELSFFSFGEDNNYKYSYKKSPKQLSYAQIVHTSIESLLASLELPEPLEYIEILQVEVSPSLCSASVFWKELACCPYTKEEIDTEIQENLNKIRQFLPAHSTVTQTPVVNFAYDEHAKYQEHLDKLFEQIKSEEDSFTSKNTFSD